MLAFLGRTILVVAILFTAYSLFHHNETINRFNTNFSSVLKHYKVLPPNILNLLVENAQNIRFALVGLLGLSVILIVKHSRAVAFLTLIGALLYTFIMRNPHYDSSEGTLNAFMSSLGIIGALLYLVGTGGSAKVKAPEPLKPTAQKKVN